MRKSLKIASAFLLPTTVVYARTKPTGEKPFIPLLTQEQHQIELQKFPQLTVLPMQAAKSIMCRIRDEKTTLSEFRHYSNRMFRLLLEEAISLQETEESVSESPVGKYNDSKPKNKLAAITVLRAGNAFLDEAMKIVPDITVGKILIQRNEENPHECNYYYSKLQNNLDGKKVLILDPMLGTGGTMIKTVDIVNQYVKQEDITIVTLISCAYGLQRLLEKYPGVKIVTGQIDPVLDGSGYLLPGVGDFGDRYFGTV